MRKLELDKLLNSYDLVLRLWGRVENKKEVRGAIARDSHGDDFPQTKAQMRELAERFGELGLRIPEKRALGLLEMATLGATYGALEKEIEFLHRCLVDHFEERMVLLIDAANTAYFDQVTPLFGDAVFTKFQKAQRDIEEAGKCLALDRNTAVVFHLMRAMEEALRALAGKIGAVVQNSDGQFLAWGVIVGNIKSKIPSLSADQQDDWTQAHNLLWGVGKALRNTTMHPQQSYTDAEAVELFEAVRGFMRHLASLV
jgi:hypothetical protein